MCTRRRSLTDWLTDQQTDRPTDRTCERYRVYKGCGGDGDGGGECGGDANTHAYAGSLPRTGAWWRVHSALPGVSSSRRAPCPPYLIPANLIDARRLGGGPGAPARAHASIPLARSLPQWPTRRARVYGFGQVRSVRRLQRRARVYPGGGRVSYTTNFPWGPTVYWMLLKRRGRYHNLGSAPIGRPRLSWGGWYYGRWYR